MRLLLLALISSSSFCNAYRLKNNTPYPLMCNLTTVEEEQLLKEPLLLAPQKTVILPLNLTQNHHIMRVGISFIRDYKMPPFLSFFIANHATHKPSEIDSTHCIHCTALHKKSPHDMLLPYETFTATAERFARLKAGTHYATTLVIHNQHWAPGGFGIAVGINEITEDFLCTHIRPPAESPIATETTKPCDPEKTAYHDAHPPAGSPLVTAMTADGSFGDLVIVEGPLV